MLFANKHLANLLIVLPASLLACQPGSIQDVGAVLERPSASAGEPSPAALVKEFDKAILVLKRGLKENWKTREQYLIAFEKTASTDSVSQTAADAKEYVECSISAHLRDHRIWDEGPPIGVEVNRTIREFKELRKHAKETKIPQDAAEFRLPPCAASRTRKVAVSARVAAGMLKTKTDPVYSGHGHVCGTVVLRATIGEDGRVESLHVISGPTLLQQAALEAASKWTYQPYRLNNKAVVVETTINVPFAPCP